MRGTCKILFNSYLKINCYGIWRICLRLSLRQLSDPVKIMSATGKLAHQIKKHVLSTEKYSKTICMILKYIFYVTIQEN